MRGGGGAYTWSNTSVKEKVGLSGANRNAILKITVFTHFIRSVQQNYRSIHLVKLSALHNDQLEYNGSQGTNGAS